MIALMVSVDYADLLQITLPYNKHHFDSVIVITNRMDGPDYREARDNGVPCWVTDAFYRNGTKFNKWLALEECLTWLETIDKLEGWICLMDADVLWPKDIGIKKETDEVLELKQHDRIYGLLKGNLYTPKRRMMTDIFQLSFNKEIDEQKWKDFPLHAQQYEWAGYTQIFHSSDPVLGSLPWHQTDWKHAGGADSFFQKKWPKEKKLRPPFEVLHLGQAGVNWAGRVSTYVDGTIDPLAKEREKYLRELMIKRRLAATTDGNDRFRHEKISKTE